MTITVDGLSETREALNAKRADLKSIYDEAGPELDMAKVKSIPGESADKVAHIRALNDEIDELAVKWEKLETLRKGAENAERWEDPEGWTEGDGERPERKSRESFADLFIKSAARTEKGSIDMLDIELKTLLETATGWVPETTRGPRLVDYATRPIELLDLIPQTTASESAVTFMEETTFTNAAAETAEGGQKPEAALAYTERTSPVRKIAVVLPVTDEQLEDVPRLRGVLDMRLPFMVRQRLSGQIIAGDGSAPNLRGILNVSGVQTQAKSTDATPDAVYKAMTKVEVTGQAIPDAAVFHPNDWQEVRLLRTTDGIYIWGNPSDAGPERIWGLRVVKAQAETEGTGLVGDFGNYTELAVRKGIEVKVSDSHSDFFIYNKQMLRAEMRAALVVYRPAAFCKVTGI